VNGIDGKWQFFSRQAPGPFSMSTRRFTL
jgi:hypothetical protein